MTRTLILTLALLMLASCGQETRVIRDNSAATKFMTMMGGTPSGSGASGGWQMARSDPPGKKKGQDAIEDPNVRVIKGVDWNGYRFNTNFQIDDPKLRQQQVEQQKKNQEAPASQPAAPMTPFGVMPAVPTR